MCVLEGGRSECVRDVGPHFGESCRRKHCDKGGDDRVVSAILTAGKREVLSSSVEKFLRRRVLI